MKGLIFVKLRSYKGFIKVLFSFLKKTWAPWMPFNYSYFGFYYRHPASITGIPSAVLAKYQNYNIFELVGTLNISETIGSPKMVSGLSDIIHTLLYLFLMVKSWFEREKMTFFFFFFFFFY